MGAGRAPARGHLQAPSPWIGGRRSRGGARGDATPRGLAGGRAPEGALAAARGGWRGCGGGGGGGGARIRLLAQAGWREEGEEGVEGQAAPLRLLFFVCMCPTHRRGLWGCAAPVAPPCFSSVQAGAGQGGAGGRGFRGGRPARTGGGVRVGLIGCRAPRRRGAPRPPRPAPAASAAAPPLLTTGCAARALRAAVVPLACHHLLRPLCAR